MKFLFATMLLFSISPLAVAQRYGREEVPPTRGFEPVATEYDRPGDIPLREYVDSINRQRKEKLLATVVQKSELENDVEEKLVQAFLDVRSGSELPPLKRFRAVEMHGACQPGSPYPADLSDVPGIVRSEVFDAPDLESAIERAQQAARWPGWEHELMKFKEPRRFTIEVCELEPRADEAPVYRVVVGFWLSRWGTFNDAMLKWDMCNGWYF